MAIRAKAPSAAEHDFVRDPDVPGDAYTQLAVCRTCGKPGKPGDAQHPRRAELPPALPPALAAAARARDFAILGERDD